MESVLSSQFGCDKFELTCWMFSNVNSMTGWIRVNAPIMELPATGDPDVSQG